LKAHEAKLPQVLVANGSFQLEKEAMENEEIKDQGGRGTCNYVTT